MLGSKSKKKIPNYYQIGRNVELHMCTFLNKLGWSTVLSPGSKGPADIMATKYELPVVNQNINQNNSVKKIKKTLCIQVKFRSEMEYHSLSSTEWHNLANHSKTCNCIPLLATISKFFGKKFEQMNTHYHYGRPWHLGNGYVGYFHNILNGEIFKL